MLVSYLPALPLGMIGREECLDLRSDRDFGEPEFLARMKDSLPRGIVFLALQRLGAYDSSLGEAVEGFSYSLDCEHPDVREALDEARAEKGWSSLSDQSLLERLALEAVPDPVARGITLSVETGPPRLMMGIKVLPSGSPRPQDIVRSIFPGLEHPVFFMARERVVFKPSPQIDKAP